MVLSVDFDGEKPKISLGIKQMTEDPWGRIPQDFLPGSVHSARVVRVLEVGAIVELEKGIDGFIHISEFSEERVESAGKFLNLGDVVRVQVLDVDPHERKISLSMKSASRHDDVMAAQGYKTDQTRATLGDVFKDKLANVTVKKS